LDRDKIYESESGGSISQ